MEKTKKKVKERKEKESRRGGSEWGEQRMAECRCVEADKLSNLAKKRGRTGTIVSKFKFLKFFFNNYPLLTSENLLLFTSFIIDKP